MKQSNHLNERNFQSLNQKVVMNEKDRNKALQTINHRMETPPVIKKASTPVRYYVAYASAALLFLLILIPTIIYNFDLKGESVASNTIPPERLEEILAPYQYHEILHVQEVDTGVVVYYTHMIKNDINIEELNAMFIKKTEDGWDESMEGGSHTFLEKDDLSHQLIIPSSEESPFPLVFGKILNPSIMAVFVNDEEAEIITSKSEEKYWFVFADVSPDEMFDIKGLNNKGASIYSISTQYPRSGSTILEEANQNAVNFELTEEEWQVYELLKEEFNKQHLKDLSPISIAKIYVQASLDEELELSYELHTDREDVMQVDREEYLTEWEHSSPEQIRDTFFGIQDGIFHDNGDSGYISYTNTYGQQWGFQMLKEEDGSWSVSFLPLQ
ncbi:hypothetical protein [Sutcliffiella rhizosphaerae]|uniref:Uncharacterized protein n=1 Tax=Sutcliffiella rhizosphaerae TaxID=2880967 RepID=A0ABN8A8U6_9BACI|nr:hypothetical protein [Sutcliffiella rhizosphaerae]CAG9620357.1 hypothetical protein BACCIP111883_01125 [Sutcliffiella rhizosphaerae]